MRFSLIFAVFFAVCRSSMAVPVVFTERSTSTPSSFPDSYSRSESTEYREINFGQGVQGPGAGNIIESGLKPIYSSGVGAGILGGFGSANALDYGIPPQYHPILTFPGGPLIGLQHSSLTTSAPQIKAQSSDLGSSTDSGTSEVSHKSSSQFQASAAKSTTNFQAGSGTAPPTSAYGASTKIKRYIKADGGPHNGPDSGPGFGVGPEAGVGIASVLAGAAGTAIGAGLDAGNLGLGLGSEVGAGLAGASTGFSSGGRPPNIAKHDINVEGSRTSDGAGFSFKSGLDSNTGENLGSSEKHDYGSVVSANQQSGQSFSSGGHSASSGYDKK